MGVYYSCPSCGNQKEGDSIYRCCNRTYCTSCVKGIMSNLINSRCPECTGLAKYLGDIESQSSDDSSSDSDSDDDISSVFDDDIDTMVSKMLGYIRARKDTASSFRKAKFSEFLCTLDWSEYPDAETLHDELNS